MENVGEPMYRSDGTRIEGLDSSEWKTYEETYRNVSPEELIAIRDTTDNEDNKPVFDKSRFEFVAEKLNSEKGMEKKHGLPATLATPLFMLLTVHVELLPILKRKSFSVYGEITSHKRDYLYKREIDDVENFGHNGGNLTLNGPSPSCGLGDACCTLESRKLSIKLYDDTHRTLVDKCIELVYSQNEFEEVKTATVTTGDCVLTLKYVSIPMAICGRLQLAIFNKLYLGKDTKSVNVCGKVVATYRNTFGNYNSEEIVLFDKNSDKKEYETVVIDLRYGYLLRTWVALPVYSSLHVHLDLFEYETNKLILNGDVEHEINPYGFSKTLVTPEYFVIESATWFPPSRIRKPQDVDDCIKGEPMDADDSGQGEYEDADNSGQGEPMDADDSGQGESKVKGGDGVQITRIQTPIRLPGFPAVEVFSVLICHNLSTPLNVHGLLRFSYALTLDYNDGGINIFKKDEKDPLSLPGRGNTIPALSGSRFFENIYPMSVICDLEDTLRKLSIKGYLSGYVARCLPGDKQLCSIFRGVHGFAALHYAIFPSAVQVNLKVSYTENGLKCVNLPVSGSFYVQYNDFDYSSGYEKNCYKIVLFKIEEEDSVPVEANGLIPLSRSSLIVPSQSSLLFDVHFMIGTREISGKGNIETADTGSMSIKKDQCEVKIDLEWSSL